MTPVGYLDLLLVSEKQEAFAKHDPLPVGSGHAVCFSLLAPQYSEGPKLFQAVLLLVVDDFVLEEELEGLDPEELLQQTEKALGS